MTTTRSKLATVSTLSLLCSTVYASSEVCWRGCSEELLTETIAVEEKITQPKTLLAQESNELLTQEECELHPTCRSLETDLQTRDQLLTRTTHFLLLNISVFGEFCRTDSLGTPHSHETYEFSTQEECELHPTCRSLGTDPQTPLKILIHVE